MNPIIYIAPPLAGAVIGYLTNVLAIKMLFRPLNEYRIGRLRVPFTPGILPRERGALARSIGAMVARELLTAEVVRQKLTQSGATDLLQEAAGLISSKIGQSYEEITAHLIGFLQKPEIHRRLEAAGHKFLSETFEKLGTTQRLVMTVGKYDQKLYDKMPEIIDSLIKNIKEFIENAETRAKILVFLETLVTGNSEKIISALDSAIPAVLQKFDVAALVENRINTLPMERVERIVLDVMADKFKWIDIFGAILGFLIGCFQSVLSIMTRG